MNENTAIKIKIINGAHYINTEKRPSGGSLMPCGQTPNSYLKTPNSTAGLFIPGTVWWECSKDKHSLLIVQIFYPFPSPTKNFFSSPPFSQDYKSEQNSICGSHVKWASRAGEIQMHKCTALCSVCRGKSKTNGMIFTLFLPPFFFFLFLHLIFFFFTLSQEKLKCHRESEKWIYLSQCSKYTLEKAKFIHLQTDASGIVGFCLRLVGYVLMTGTHSTNKAPSQSPSRQSLQ